MLIFYIFVFMAKPETIRLYTDIRKDFNELNEVREFGVQKYTTGYILARLAHKYYRSPKTIENIVFGRTAIDPAQHSLF